MANQLLKYIPYSPPDGKGIDIHQHFWSLANFLDSRLPEGSEKTVALRKLIEAKDAAMRAISDIV